MKNQFNFEKCTRFYPNLSLYEKLTTWSFLENVKAIGKNILENVMLISREHLQILLNDHYKLNIIMNKYGKEFPDKEGWWINCDDVSNQEAFEIMISDIPRCVVLKGNVPCEKGCWVEVFPPKNLKKDV